MARILESLEALPWTSIEIPLGFQRAAARLEGAIGPEEVQAVARGFVGNNECVACLTGTALHVAVAGALSVDVERWSHDETDAALDSEKGRVLVELTARGRRSVLRLKAEAATSELVRRLRATLEPVAEMTFRPYVARS